MGRAVRRIDTYEPVGRGMTTSPSLKSCREPSRSARPGVQKGSGTKIDEQIRWKNNFGCATPRWLGFEAGLRWILERAGLQVADFDTEAWRSRGILLRSDDESTAEEAPRNALALPTEQISPQWIRARCFNDVLSRRREQHEFVVRAKSLSKLHRKAKLVLERQLIYWVEHARDRRTCVGKSVGGVGIFAAMNISPDTMLARGELDADTCWESSGLAVELKKGSKRLAALGPISMANAGCDRCANARLVPKTSAKLVELHAGAPDYECTIPKGDEILINHKPPPGSVWYCPRCQAEIR